MTLGKEKFFIVTPDLPNPNITPSECTQDDIINYYTKTIQWQNIDYDFLNRMSLQQIISLAMGRSVPAALFKEPEVLIAKDKKSKGMPPEFDIGATLPFPTHYHPYHPHYLSTSTAIAICNQQTSAVQPQVGPVAKKLAAAVLTNQAFQKDGKRGDKKDVGRDIIKEKPIYKINPNDINLDLHENPAATMETFNYVLRYGMNYKSFSNQNHLNDVIWLLKSKKNAVTRGLAKAIGFFSKSLGMKKDWSKLKDDDTHHALTLEEQLENHEQLSNANDSTLHQKSPSSTSTSSSQPSLTVDTKFSTSPTPKAGSPRAASSPTQSESGGVNSPAVHDEKGDKLAPLHPNDGKGVKVLRFNQKVDVNSVNDKPRFKYNKDGTVSPDSIKKGGSNKPSISIPSSFGKDTHIYTIPIDVNLNQIYSQTFVLQTPIGGHGSGMNFVCYEKLIEGLPFAIVPHGRLPLHERTYDGFGLPSIQKQPRKYRLTTPVSSFPSSSTVLSALVESTNDPQRLQKKRREKQSRLNKKQREYERAAKERSSAEKEQQQQQQQQRSSSSSSNNNIQD
jgi:hypothetical protein